MWGHRLATNVLRPALAPFAPLALLALLAPSALAQEGPPATMVHIDFRYAPPQFIPAEVRIAPGGEVTLMLFDDEPAASLTLDGRSEEADVAPPNGSEVRVATLQAPGVPGRYPFHDKHGSGATGALLVEGTPLAPPAREAPGAPLLPLALGALGVALARRR